MSSNQASSPNSLPNCFPSGTNASIRRVNVVRATSAPPQIQTSCTLFVKIEDKDMNILIGPEDLERRDLFFLRNCSNCTYTIDTPFTKLLIEGCNNLTIHLNQKIMTNIIEIWKSNQVSFEIKDPVYTVQVDMCNNIDFQFSRKQNFQQIVWSQSENLLVAFDDIPGIIKSTGLTQMKKIHQDILDEVDQFYLRFVGGELTDEIMIRLPGGFPSTERECEEWEAEHKQTLPLPIM